ncbi:bifunctional DNA-formamidopyrimidine glycosylase/DNA-(apurinic or apyrimidinic site) lyase [Desulfofalx alkaliphila]|uniref:bifunctional DNA-formamidopyrimidine glycosylase/DNA-(apurinic or apyrimidinic site) lyase n=1 Tax=Desulfofalx alkaliphila TaxID=105483 RepID=UPI0004E0DF50|nr:bifunctional DNA-formamidopyrimidine glycosylase/DNA-(apurinic or apyrimidinic site) lyase [Desulfofalx alkaliphila]
MPELPEVETIKHSLQTHITGLTIADVKVFLPKIIRSHTPGDFKKALVGQKVKDRLYRRGKYLMIPLSERTLVVHFRMTGRLVFLDEKTDLPKYTHLLFVFDNGRQMAFADMRQFGQIHLLPNAEVNKIAGIKNMGPEPLGDNFTVEYFQRELKRRRAKIKSLLLNQSFVAGLGNIYADEALHLAKIDPERPAQQLTKDEIIQLHQAIVAVLQQGIKNRGTSFRDYVDAQGNIGNNQDMLQAYNRKGQPCNFCGTAIERKKVTGRSSYYCPQCQT